MKSLSLGRISLALALAAAVSVPALGAPLGLSETPLIVSITVSPNVMLLVDNSGSMDEVVWHNEYDPEVAYPVAAYYAGTIFGFDAWFEFDRSSTYFMAGFRQSTCVAGKYRFRNAQGNSVCLALPSPAGTLTRFRGNYLRFLVENRPADIPSENRIGVARNVARQLVLDNPGVRFGVARLNAPLTDRRGNTIESAPGGKVIAACGSPQETLVSRIDDLVSDSNTPIAETLYEVTRYFRGLDSQYNAGLGYTSPIQYRCQKNFTVVITDGLPTHDTTFPNNDPDDVANADATLPNWDGLAPATGIDPPFPRYSDGFAPQGVEAAEGYSLYLDDIAKFGRDIDMRKDGVDAAGESFDDPAHAKQNMNTYTVGFSLKAQMLEDAAEQGDGLYYTANNADQLSLALQQALRDIQNRLTSSAAAAANAGFINEGSRVYQARFNSESWAGGLLAFKIDSDPTSATYGKIVPQSGRTDGALWDAGTLIPAPGARSIFTRVGGSGALFSWSSFSSGVGGQQQTYFNDNEALFNYIRGTDSAAFRARSTPLGDIVNSAPTFVGPPNARYANTLESVNYSSFKTTYKDRSSLIYAGANDGMLHAFDAESGVEKMAYVPGVLLPSLKGLAAVDYTDRHRFFVDGSPTVSDAFVDGAWRTVLVGGLNKGGQGIYALNITNPDDFGASTTNADKLSMWEFTDADDVDLGFTYSQPAIVKLPNGKWAAVFGNGYNNTQSDGQVSVTGNAVVYIVDLLDGSLISKIDTGVGMSQDPTNTTGAPKNRPNGFATLAPVDIDGDYKIDYIYGGDLFGNLWRIRLTSNGTTLSTTTTKIFKACASNTCDTTNAQPITTRPSVTRHPSGSGVMVFFGTGKFIESIDKVAGNGGLQSFYGIWDKSPNATSDAALVSRSSLHQQQILVEDDFEFTTDGVTTSYPLRVTTNSAPDWASKKGWFIDLQSPGVTALTGERQVTNSLVRNGRVIFTTLIPTEDPCRAGGESWLMEFNAATGSRLDMSPFDLNQDGSFTTADYVEVVINGETVRVPVSGRKLEGGAAATPSVTGAEGQREFKYISTAGGLEVVKENPGTTDTDRQSWRQLGR